MTTLESVNNHSVTDANMDNRVQTRKKKAVGVSEEAFGLVTGALTHFYSDPIYATARETIANAIDACTAAGVEKRVDITVTGDLTYSSEVAFTDYGTGMSMDTLMDVFAEFGISTKRGGDNTTGAIVADADEFTGEFGLGGKTPYALSNTFTVLTERDGQATLGVFTRNNEDMGECDPFPQEATGQNGTTVTVPLRRHQRQEMISAVKRVAYAMPQGSVTLNGDTLPSIYDTSEKIEHGRIVPDPYEVGLKPNSVYVLMAGLIYPLTNMDDVLELPSIYSRSGQALILEAENHRYKPTPQRDLLRKTEKNRERLTEDLKELYDTVVDHYAKSLNDMTWLEAAQAVRGITRDLSGIVPDGYIEGNLMWRGIVLNETVSVGELERVEDEETGFARLQPNDECLFTFTKTYGKGRSAVNQNPMRISAYEVNPGNQINGIIALTGFSNPHNPSEELSPRKVVIGINQLCNEYGGNNELLFIMLDDEEVIEKEWLKIGGEDSHVRMVSKDELIEMGTTPRTMPGGRAAIKYTVRTDSFDEDGMYVKNSQEFTTAELREFAENSGETLYVTHEKTMERENNRLRINLLSGRTVIYLTGGQKTEAMLNRIEGSVDLMTQVEHVTHEALDAVLSEHGGREGARTAMSAYCADVPDWVIGAISIGVWNSNGRNSNFYQKFADFAELRENGVEINRDLRNVRNMIPQGEDFNALREEVDGLWEFEDDENSIRFDVEKYPLLSDFSTWTIRHNGQDSKFTEHIASYIDMVDSMDEEA